MNFAQFQRPQRYIGNEWNVIKKNHDGKIKICLSYPDLYEVGMSNLGLRILYSLFNEFSDVVCERVFYPASDFINYLNCTKTPLFSLETKSPLKNFDAIGFNLGCELNYTNFLDILELAGIPLESKNRPEHIIIAGGVHNPEPIAEFTDVFFMGEFEESCPDFIDILRKYKDKDARLKALSERDGFYVPSFYSSVFNGARYVFEKKYQHAKLPVKKVYVKDLNKAHYPTRWLVPYAQIVHDRIQLEISRGCPNRCNFCQARGVYFPYREKSIPAIKNLMEENYKSSGYEEMSFLALSASDYSRIEDLFDEALGYLKNKKVSITLPSLRVDDMLGRLYSKISTLKNTSLTVAVESASQCLREKLNKSIDIAKLFEAASFMRSLKIRHLKLYFMFGFNSETEDDLSAIGQFVRELHKKSRLKIHVSINAFVPKPFSLWEAESMGSENILADKKNIILKNLPASDYIQVNISNIEKNIFEGIVSRADRKFSRAILNAYRKGARLDSDKDAFNWPIWQKAMEEENIDYNFYLRRGSENYPWSFISIDDLR